MSVMAVPQALSAARFPLLALLHPRAQFRLTAALLAIGLLVGAIGMWYFGWPRWYGTVAILALLLIPGVRKWRDDARYYGRAIMVLSVLLAAQGFHGIEHITQWVQYHLLHWPMPASSGLISAANAEWVHFVWNWSVVVVVAYLVFGGMRNRWAWLLLAWALAHSLEHAYLFIRYQQTLAELQRLGVTNVSAQGLPGFFGRDGWLAASSATQGTFLCRLPGFTTAPRLDVHFWWNIGETALLLLAGHRWLRSVGSPTSARDARIEPGSAPV